MTRWWRKGVWCHPSSRRRQCHGTLCCDHRNIGISNQRSRCNFPSILGDHGKKATRTGCGRGRSRGRRYRSPQPTLLVDDPIQTPRNRGPLSFIRICPGTSPTEGKALIVPPLELLLVIEGCLKIDLGVFSISCSQFTGTGWNCRVHAWRQANQHAPVGFNFMQFSHWLLKLVRWGEALKLVLHCDNAIGHGESFASLSCFFFFFFIWKCTGPNELQQQDKPKHRDLWQIQVWNYSRGKAKITMRCSNWFHDLLVAEQKLYQIS